MAPQLWLKRCNDFISIIMQYAKAKHFYAQAFLTIPITIFPSNPETSWCMKEWTRETQRISSRLTLIFYCKRIRRILMQLIKTWTFAVPRLLAAVPVMSESVFCYQWYLYGEDVTKLKTQHRRSCYKYKRAEWLWLAQHKPTWHTS